MVDQPTHNQTTDCECPAGYEAECVFPVWSCPRKAIGSLHQTMEDEPPCIHGTPLAVFCPHCLNDQYDWRSRYRRARLTTK